MRPRAYGRGCLRRSWALCRPFRDSTHLILPPALTCRATDCPVPAGLLRSQVLYSLAGVDPSIHTGDVIVADMLNGQKRVQDGVQRRQAPGALGALPNLASLSRPNQPHPER